MLSDFRYSFRRLKQDRVFTLLAIAALALGIGGATAVYSLIHGVLLNPFPYAHADRLMAVAAMDPSGQGGRNGYTHAELLDIQESNKVFEDIVGTIQQDIVLTGVNQPARLLGAAVTANTFPFFGMAPLMGRGIDQRDAQPDAPKVTVLNHKAWTRYFGSDPNVVGKNVRLNEELYEIVGVMPPRFGWQGADVWTPLRLNRAQSPNDLVFVLGRLKPEFNEKSAAEALKPLFSELSTRYPKQYARPNPNVVVTSLRDLVVQGLKQVLVLLLCAVGFLLLIACGNVGNLSLARATAREKEIAVRLSMGATRGRIVRQLMAESLLLAAAGAVAGTILAQLSVDWLLTLVPPQSIPAEAVVSVNMPVLLFGIGISAVTAILFGLAPALQASRKDVQTGLRDAGKGTDGGFRHGKLRAALVVVQVAMSFVLLTGSATLMRSLLALRDVKLGFSPDNLVGLRVPFNNKRYDTKEKIAAYMQQIADKVAATPGVRSVSIHTGLPPYSGGGAPLEIVGKPGPEIPAVLELSDHNTLAVLGLTMRQGRPIEEQDVRGARPVGMVNQTFATRFFPGQSPLGHRVKIKPLPDFPTIEIIGVYADVKNSGLEGTTAPEMYMPHTITEIGGRSLLVRTGANPDAMLDPIRRAVSEVNPDQPLGDLRTLRQSMREFSYALPEFGAILVAVFASIGLALMVIGVYSVLAYAVTRSTHEIGIRMALGAEASHILRRTLDSGLRLVAIGVALGLALAFASTLLLRSLVFQVSPADPWTLALVCGLTGIAGIAACLAPAKKATKVDPLVALRFQ